MHTVTTMKWLQLVVATLAVVTFAEALQVGEGRPPASGTGPESPGRICPPGWTIYDFFNSCKEPTEMRFKRPNCNCVPASICTAADTEPAWANDLLCRETKVCCFNFSAEAYPVYDTANSWNICGEGYPIGPVRPGEAGRAEMPSVVAILNVTAGKTWSPSEELVATGVMIHWAVVLTTAHTLANISAKEIKIRAWQLDSQNATQYNKEMEVNVKRIIVHPRYEKPTLAYDAALLFLEKPYEAYFVCVASSLPQPGTKCHVTGWGQRTVGGPYATRLKKVPVPIVDRVQCEDALSRTRYGRVRLHQSTVCAGGRAGEDACRGDGGAPLLCPVPGLHIANRPRHLVAGLVSWGVGCGTAVAPAVYVDVAKLFIWITKSIERQGIDPNINLWNNE